MCSRVAIVALMGLITFLHLSASGVLVEVSLMACQPLLHEALVSLSALFQFLIQAVACLPVAFTVQRVRARAKTIRPCSSSCHAVQLVQVAGAQAIGGCSIFGHWGSPSGKELDSSPVFSSQPTSSFCPLSRLAEPGLDDLHPPHLVVR